jgi:hypothetical protein
MAYALERPREWQPPPPGVGRLPEDPPWKQVFKDLHRLKRLGRSLRFFGWQLAHGVLPVGGVSAPWWEPREEDGGSRRGQLAEPAAAAEGTGAAALAAPGLVGAAGQGGSAGQAAEGGPLSPAQRAEAYARHCGCEAECCLHGHRPPGEPPPCETLAHVFVRCPVVWPAVQWLRRLCGRALGAAPPEDNIVDIIVTGAKNLWKPPGQGNAAWDLWTHLRLQFCYTVWTLTVRRADGGPQFDAAGIVAATAAALERAILHDWRRVWIAGEGLVDMPSWCDLGVKRVQLKPEAFDARWLAGGVLAHLAEGGGQGALRVHVPRSLVGPVPGS